MKAGRCKRVRERTGKVGGNAEGLAPDLASQSFRMVERGFEEVRNPNRNPENVDQLGLAKNAR